MINWTFVCRNSSNSKASIEDSLSGVSTGSKKTNTATLRSIVEMTRKKNMYGQSNQATDGDKRLSHNGAPEVAQNKLALFNKIYKKSKQPVPPTKEEVVKFELVEDIDLVTIPTTSCLFVLLSYIIFGAVLFASWEVKILCVNPHQTGN